MPNTTRTTDSTGTAPVDPHESRNLPGEVYPVLPQGHTGILGEGSSLPPRRAVLAALLAAACVGTILSLGLAGAIERPRAVEVLFWRGTALAEGERDRLTAWVLASAGEPRLVFRVTGHTAPEGDASANLALSRSRAKAVADIMTGLGIAQDRLVFVDGVGGAAPPPAIEGESPRERARRAARVRVEAHVR